jgi:hypothetical protein
MEKDDEEQIADQIELLKNERLFTATIRQGIQLITSLRDGNLDVLFEFFPWIKPEMINQFQAMGLIPADIGEKTSSESEKQQTNVNSQANNKTSHSTNHVSSASLDEEKRLQQLRSEQMAYEQELEKWAREREKQIAAQWEHIEREKERLAAEREKNQSTLEKKLERLEQLLIQQGNQPIDRPGRGRGGKPKSLGSLRGGPKPLGGTNLPPPQFDDEDDADLLEVKESEGGKSNSSMNFIKSVQRLMEL